MADRKKELLSAARSARKKAYAPYSGFRVGAAVLGSDGRIFSGCNVENASFGLTCCAERNAIFAMVAAGVREIREVLVIGETAEFLPPCGACRQVIAEFAPPEVVVHLGNHAGACRDVPVSELIPFIFRLKKKHRSRAPETIMNPEESK
jgi:cytidine deaminase